MELAGPDQQRAATQSYTVIASDGIEPGTTPPSHPRADVPPIQLARTLLRVRSRTSADRPPIEPGDVPLVTTPNEPWLKTPLSPGETLAPGDMLLVREEFRIVTPFVEVEWKQIVPSNCFSVITRPEDTAGIGPVSRRNLHSITWSAPNVPAGERVHEYVITAVRPGVAWLPPPQVSQMREALAVEAETLQLTVRESTAR